MIEPHISSALRDPGVIFDKSILFSSPKLEGADPAGTEQLCYGAKNEQKNTEDNVIEGDLREEMII